MSAPPRRGPDTARFQLPPFRSVVREIDGDAPTMYLVGDVAGLRNLDLHPCACRPCFTDYQPFVFPPSSVCSWRELQNHPTPYRTLIRASAGLRKNVVPRAFQNCSRVTQLPGSRWRLRSMECVGDGCTRAVIGDAAVSRERSRTGGRDPGCSVHLVLAPVCGPSIAVVRV